MKITLEHSDKNILEYFEQVTGWLNLEEKLDEINDEYLRTKEAFAHLDILCNLCNGTARLETGETCDHPGGTFQRVLVLNSDWITTSESGFSIIAHKELIEEAQEESSDIPDHVKDLITQTGLVPLSNRTLVRIESLAGQEFIEHIFQLIAEMQGFVDEDDSYYFPKVTVE